MIIQKRPCLSESDKLYKHHPQSTYEDNFLGKTFDIARIIENLFLTKKFLLEMNKIFLWDTDTPIF